MRILVPIKRVLDYSLKVRVAASGKCVETTNLKHCTNPFDEIALEEAVRIKERMINQMRITVIAASIGSNECVSNLKNAYAIGADLAIHVNVADSSMHFLHDSLNVATILKALVAKQKANLVICGKQAVDSDAGQTGQMLAGMLNWPQVLWASKIEHDPESDGLKGKNEISSLKVTSETEKGTETFIAKLPAVITVDLRLNTPRYTTIQAIMKAKNKKIDVETLETLEVADLMKNRMQIIKVEEPAAKTHSVQMMQSVEHLLDALVRDKHLKPTTLQH